MALIQRSLIGIIGVVFLLVFTFVTAVFSGTLIWLIWGNLGPEFFKAVPEAWLNIGWWNAVKMTWLGALVGGVIFKPSGITLE